MQMQLVKQQENVYFFKCTVEMEAYKEGTQWEKLPMLFITVYLDRN